MGRPKKDIKIGVFENLCKIQCTEDEICGVLSVSKSTLLEWCKEHYDGKTFQEVFKILSAAGKASLRRLQFEQAQDNPKMAIWLGKQYLGQRENIEVSANDEQLAKLDSILGGVQRVAANMAQAKTEEANSEADGGDDEDIEEI